MDSWTRIAREKLSDLIRRDDFVALLVLSNHSALIEFKNEACRMSGFGKVEWGAIPPDPLTAERIAFQRFCD